MVDVRTYLVSKSEPIRREQLDFARRQRAFERRRGELVTAPPSAIEVRRDRRTPFVYRPEPGHSRVTTIR